MRRLGPIQLANKNSRSPGRYKVAIPITRRWCVLSYAVIDWLWIDKIQL